MPSSCQNECRSGTREGAKIAELAISGIATVAVTYGFARYCLGLFLPEIRREFLLADEQIGWIAGASYFGYLVATLAGATISALFGPRIPAIIGGIAAGAGMAMIGSSTDALSLAIGVFIAGTSPGFAYPPVSDIVTARVPPDRRNTVYAWINSGTGFGVAIAGPVTYFAGTDWRSAWYFFAAVALSSALWNIRVLAGTARKAAWKAILPIFRQDMARAKMHFAAAVLFGMATSVYWIHSVDLITQSRFTDVEKNLFWVIVGASGMAGGLAARLVTGTGLAGAYRLLMFLMGVTIVALPLLSESRAAVFFSGGVFGAGFITATAIFGMWSMRIFSRTPSLGFGASFFLISLGQGIGPVVAGYGISWLGFGHLFTIAGLVCIFAALFTRAETMAA